MNRMTPDRLHLRLLPLLAAACVVAAAGACDSGDVTFPETNDDGDAEAGVPFRAVAADADAAEAGAAGLEAGGIRGARIWTAFEGATQVAPPDSQTTDDSGVAVFPERRGTLRTTAFRRLSPEEVEAASGSFPTLRAFAGGDKFSVSSSPDTQAVALGRNLTGSLVISELPAVGYQGRSTAGTGFYELYNNSEQTIYLDGKILGRAQSAWRESDNFTCEEQEVRVDPDGIWSRFFQQFPGSGTDHPVEPGETVVVANQAVDHTEVHSWLPNLENADFEMVSAVDNPDVPNLIDIGPRSSTDVGIQIILGFEWAPFLAEPVDVDALSRQRILAPLSDDVFVRIPTDKVIDVVTTDDDQDGDLCRRKLHQTFDRLPKTLYGIRTEGATVQRRAVGTAPGGWTIYLDSNTSEADFVVEQMTPGRPLEP